MPWYNPKYYPDGPPQEASHEPPQETGEPLGSFPRNQGAEELRVSLNEYQGRPYVSLRVWERDPQTGKFWPSKRGVSVRIRECAQLADILRGVASRKTAEQGTRPPHQARDEAPAGRTPMANLPQASAAGSGRPNYQLEGDRPHGPRGPRQGKRQPLMEVREPVESGEPPFDEFGGSAGDGA